MSSSTSITAIIPQLPSLDLARSSQFYQQLGFREIGHYPALLLLQFDAQELHFWLTTDATLGATSSCYLRVQQIEVLHARYAAIPGLLQAEYQLAPRPWGMNEFYLIDPDGNLLKFGEPTQQVAPRT